MNTIVSLLSLAALSSAPFALAETNMRRNVVDGAREITYDLIGKSSVRLRFDKGSAVLTEEAQSRLRALVNDLDRPDRNLVIGAWGDQDGDRTTAEQRLSAISTFLKQLKVEATLVTRNLDDGPKIREKTDRRTQAFAKDGGARHAVVLFERQEIATH